MLGKLMPLLLPLVGLGAGVGGGLMLRPPAQVVEIDPCAAPTDGEHGELTAVAHEPEADTSTYDYVKLNNQFVIPDIEGDRIAAMVVMSLNLETDAGFREAVYAREPKLRDAFLQVLFDHANAGGFKGTFTDSAAMSTLRRNLVQAAQVTVGTEIHDVLVTDIVRQDMN